MMSEAQTLKKGRILKIHYLARYALAPLSVGVILGLAFLTNAHLPEKSLLLLFFIPVVVSAGIGGLGPGALATFLSAITCEYFLFPPLYTIAVARQDQIPLTIFALAGLLVSAFSELLHGAYRNAQQEIIQRKQAAEELHHANEDLELRVQERTAELLQANTALKTANRVALDILASRTGMEALRRIADAARTLAHARYAALGVARHDGQGLLEFATVGLSAQEEAAIGARPKGAGILGLLLKRKDPLRIDNLSTHPASSGFPANHPSMTSFLGVPIWRDGTMLGSLYLTNKEDGNAFTDEDEVAVQALGDYAAVAIHNLHLLSRQRALVSGLIAAQEEERRAVAYDLHDGLTQYVMASHAHLEAFKRAHQAGHQEKAEREMELGLRYLKEAVVESRRLVNGLRSLALDDLGLAGAVEQLLADEKVRAGWQEADLIHNIAGRRFDPTLETAAYRVAQEAITNARKHADTTSMRVTLQFCSEEPESLPYLHLEIRDWGKGFVPEEKIGLEGHVGLQGMAERVSLLGGTYTLESAPQAGTVVRATFPLLEAAQED